MTTEHQLQELLTREWAKDGVEVDGELHFVVAWEVMDTYRINSARLGFGRPAIDFLLLDERGGMAAVELKMSVRSRRDSWAVLCQVHRRSVLLARAFTPNRLARAHRDCYSGQYGRLERPEPQQELRESHARFFRREPLESIVALPIRRVVAAPEFGRHWEDVREIFTAGERELIEKEVSAFSQKGWPGTEFKKWLDDPWSDTGFVAPGISTLMV